MKNFSLEGSVDTPNIIFDKETGKLEISGKSFPEETKRFYTPILNWIEEYLENSNKKTEVIFKMDYFNSSTSTIFLDIFYLLDKSYKKGNDITIHWDYLDIDDDILEAGEEFEEMISIPFKFKAYK
ncbi:MAG: DUF1987 domain-containing protein [Bacteroidales bacterium]|jgi:hypothetical protein|nr:DUF1987 domain-containing protein [Bacteroidales bacterium]